MKKKILILIPAYNEEKNIVSVLTKLNQSKFIKYCDVLVIDDGSTDHTREKAEECHTKVIRQIFNMGYGAALQTGYKYAEKKEYEFLIQMDADGQHDIENIERISEALQSERKPDIVIGSRYLNGSQSFKQSKIRLFAIWMFRKIIRIFTGDNITDPTSGLQGLSRKAFSKYAQFQWFDIRYPDLNMILQMIFLGYRVEEVPAIMHERTEGEAMHSGIIRPMKYMILMSLSSVNAIIRYRKLARRIRQMNKE